jgi:hypothetical protein
MSQQRGILILDLGDPGDRAGEGAPEDRRVRRADRAVLGRDRRAVRVGRGVAQDGVEAILQGLGEGVFEAVGLGVDLVPGHPEVLAEEGLQQAMVAQHL